MPLQQEELTRFHEIFASLNDSGKGLVFKDFKEFFSRVSIFPSDSELQKLFQVIERDGYVSLENILELFDDDKYKGYLTTVNRRLMKTYDKTSARVKQNAFINIPSV